MFFLILGFFIAPFAEHSFVLDAIRKLYQVRTEDTTLFLTPKSDKAVERQKKKRKAARKLDTETQEIFK